MILCFVVVLLLSFYRVKPVKPFFGALQPAYLAPDRTTSIKGIFILLVFLSHANNYLLDFPAYAENVLNGPYIDLQAHLGQGVVVMFLFYSGYGVMESVQKKGLPYIHAIPRQRIFRTLLHFDAAVLLYLLLELSLGTLKRKSLPTILLAFTGWTSLGNSNWYIFAVLMLYLFTFIAFCRFAENPVRALWLVTGFTTVYIAVLVFLKDAWWFDTVLLYPIGMWYSFGKARIEGFLCGKAYRFWLVFSAVFVAMVVSHLLRANYLCYELWLITLALFIVLLTMKVEIGNPVLNFFGKHLFEIYILMRIPMLILLALGVTQTYSFVGIGFAATVLLAVVFQKLLGILDKVMFERIKRRSVRR